MYCMYRKIIRIAALFAGLSLVTGGLLVPRLSAAPPATPVRTPSVAAGKAASGLQKIAPGEYQCFYLVDGKIWGVGSNRAGQLGIGMNSSHAAVPPIKLKFPPDVRLVDVAAGGYHSLALDSSGHVWTWGGNAWGQKGDGSPIDRPGTSPPEANGLPAKLATDAAGKDFGDVVGVESGWCINLALKKDGTVWVWGRNDKEVCGIVGNGDTTTAAFNRPTQVPFDPPVSIVQIATSGNLIMARDSQGGVWSWGGGEGSKATRGTNHDEFSRPHRVPDLPPAKTIAVGDQFSYALDADGNLWGWGAAATYLGLGSPKGQWLLQPTPKKLDFPEFGGRRVASVVVSAHTTHVILDDGSLWGWGDSALGEVGNGEMLDFSKHNYNWDWGKFERMVFRPVRIAAEAGNFNAIYTNAMCFYCYATTADGKFYSWGRNKTGVLGDGVQPIGKNAEHPDSWNVATATQVFPLTQKTVRPVPSKP